jgi:hypothetical protein
MFCLTLPSYAYEEDLSTCILKAKRKEKCLADDPSKGKVTEDFNRINIDIGKAPVSKLVPRIEEHISQNMCMFTFKLLHGGKLTKHARQLCNSLQMTVLGRGPTRKSSPRTQVTLQITLKLIKKIEIQPTYLAYGISKKHVFHYFGFTKIVICI